ncbi:hypothetical protein NPIL_379291 [Nephila pilipes]|uniref:Uncharacterized protein n=1 Tax=Nephila pilipes TaxID=299642 RepID=A0A8X6MZ54_NEPPI|nr:hypothetical protein NPIL_379291 [Nephila pilipes]
MFRTRCWKFTRDNEWQHVCYCFLVTVPCPYSIKCLSVTKSGAYMTLPRAFQVLVVPPGYCPSLRKTTYIPKQDYALCLMDKSSSDSL